MKYKKFSRSGLNDRTKQITQNIFDLVISHTDLGKSNSSFTDSQCYSKHIYLEVDQTKYLANYSFVCEVQDYEEKNFEIN